MTSSLPPGAILVLGAPLLALLRGRALQAGLLALPVLSFLHMWLGFELGDTVSLAVWGLDLQPVRYDRLARVWGLVFHIAALGSAVFALGVKDRLQHVMGLAYAGSAILAVFAGDLVSLFTAWELTAVTSVFLVWATGTPRAYASGLRYLLVQVLSGVLLLAGVLFRYDAGLGLSFDHLGLTGGIDTTLIFLAFGIKAAFPLLHNWLEDAYPNATPTGTVWLSAFTTKLAIYALARGFAGTEVLVVLGVVMALLPSVYALLEDDLRRVLAYSLNTQLGFMVVGVGIGTELALNGAASHAFVSTIYQGLLFMAMGAVLYRTGTARASELGGLHRSMPWTLALCLVGSAAISGVPFTAGFVTKSMIVSAAGHEHLTLVYLALLFAAAGVFVHSGIRVPFDAFFARDRGLRPDEAPPHMLAAMALLAALCVGVGVYPGALYGLLPFEVDYAPYTVDHLVTQVQLLLGAGLAFGLVRRIGAWPAARPGILLDADWLYRRALPAVATTAWGVATATRGFALATLFGARDRVVEWAVVRTGPGSRWDSTLSASGAAFAVAALLTLYGLLFFTLGDPSLSAGAPGGHP